MIIRQEVARMALEGCVAATYSKDGAVPRLTNASGQKVWLGEEIGGGWNASDELTIIEGSPYDIL